MSRMSGYPQDLVPLVQAAADCTVRPRTMRRWITRGRLQGWRVGGRVWVSAAQVVAFRASGRVSGLR